MAKKNETGVIEEKVSQHQIFMEWVTPAYPMFEKSWGWYFLMMVIVLGFVAYDVWTGGWIVSVTFLLMAAVYFISQLKPTPTLVKVQITDHGVRFGQRFYEYSQLKSFYLILDEDYKVLYLSVLKGLERRISILITEEVNTAILREYLLLQIREEVGKKESFSDQLIRNLGL